MLKSPTSVAVASGLVFGVLYFIALPAFIAGLGWGVTAGVIAIGIAGLVAAAIGGPGAGIIHVVAFGAPAAFICYLAQLNRQTVLPADSYEGSGPATSTRAVEWYPVGRLLAWLFLMAGAFGMAGAAMLGTDLESYRAAMNAAVREDMIGRFEEFIGRELGTEEREGLVNLAARSLPGVLAGGWLLLMLPSLWLAARIVEGLRRLPRPWQPIPDMSYPSFLPVCFAAALLATYAPGIAGIWAGGFASALTLGYVIMGLAVMHAVTDGMTLRPLLLGMLYLAVLAFGQLSIIALTIIGVLEAVVGFRRRLNRTGGPSPPNV